MSSFNSIMLTDEINKSISNNDLTNEAMLEIVKLVDFIQQKISYENEKTKELCARLSLCYVGMKWKEYNVEKNAFKFFTRLVMEGLAKAWKTISK